MKKIVLIVFCLCLGFYVAKAQEVVYSNVVLGVDGQPIMGAMVEVAGTSVKTVTDMEGKFTIMVPEGYTTLTVSYGGMKKQLVAITRKPVVLYKKGMQVVDMQSATQVVQPGRRQQQTAQYMVPGQKTKVRDYKKNIFNLEIGYEKLKESVDGHANYDYDEEGLNLGLGYHHFFLQYFAWEVFNVNYHIAIDDDYEAEDMFWYEASVRLTSGFKFSSPYFYKHMSAWVDVRGGMSYDGRLDEFGPTYGLGVGLNLSKTFYLAAKFDWTKNTVEGYEFGDYDVTDKFISFRLGFNFGK